MPEPGSAGAVADVAGAVLAVALVVAVTAGLIAGLAGVRRRLLLVTVLGESMLPTLRPGDRVLVVRRAGHRLRPGDVVLLRAPGPPDPVAGGVVVKRLVGVAGDPLTPDMRAVVGAARVPSGRVLVRGDGRRSTDSRVWGALPAASLIGKVLTAQLTSGHHP